MFVHLLLIAFVFSGLVLEEKEANALMDRMGKEEREHVEAYLVQYTGTTA